MSTVSRAVGRAHAKLIILGEHFVVSGSSALAVPLKKLQTEVRLEAAESVSCTVDPSSVHLGFNDEVRGLMKKALNFSAARFQWDLEQKPLRIFSSSNFPISRGLGSSASFSVALTRAFSGLSGKEPDLRKEAQELENLFHGKSSGLDTASIATGEPILYRNGEILRTFVPTAVDFVVADSGPRNTAGALVAKTMDLRKNKPQLWESLARQLDQLTEQCLSDLGKPDGAADVARSIRGAQKILSEIGLLNDGLAELLQLGEKCGALAGKLSGAGSGGVAFFATRRGEGRTLANRMREAGAQIVCIA